MLAMSQRLSNLSNVTQLISSSAGNLSRSCSRLDTLFFSPANNNNGGTVDVRGGKGMDVWHVVTILS